jgi:copper chaperone CopZ/outer membrane receptor protein involved in Fe transport
MANNRDFVISGILEPERAINYTLNYTHSYRWLQKDVSLSLDVYQTNFFSSIVADPFAQSDKTIVKSEQNNSRSNGLVFTIIQELPANLELKLGYKYTNSEALLANNWQQRPLLPVHRALANLHYRSTNKRWEVSTTLQYVGSQTLAPVIGNVTTDLPEYRLTQKAPAYLQLLAQITYSFPWGLEVYLGGENLTNYTQYQPIAGWELTGAPNTPAFDASQIWAPIMGRMFYVGMRYKLPSSKTASMTHLDIKTSAQCNMCKEYIETALKKIKGVEDAKLNLATKEVEVVYDSKLCTPEMLKKAISEAGYQADEVAPNKAIYDKLPECCKHQ